MTYNIFFRLFPFLFILLITITILDAADPIITQPVKFQSSKSVVPQITSKTLSSISQILPIFSTVTQSLSSSPTPAQKYNHEFQFIAWESRSRSN
ncbi:hypothetical protein C2G38_2092525 [Gigaspora rosea]|uniref:Uncharacterized protein n=1 Tax=Gigaspora rosea TaxID=44941 RepID=A0A397V743_9GLOM|nr:hypothetical protein C2G38_2092525 [Gigaspora rosea]